MGGQALRALLNSTRSAEPEIRALAAETLGLMRQTPAVPTLKLLLRDPDVRVRAAAETALKQIGANSNS
jgi:HEAT repeat protein